MALGPVGGALVQACSPDDVSCREPLAHGMTDADGWLHLPVPNAAGSLGNEGLNGFARISRPDLLTTDLYWGFPLVEGSFPVALTEVVTTAENQQLLDNLQVTPIPGRGELTVFVLDCLYQPAPGVMVTLSPPADASTKEFNTQGPATATDARGLVLLRQRPCGSHDDHGDAKRSARAGARGSRQRAGGRFDDRGNFREDAEPVARRGMRRLGRADLRRLVTDPERTVQNAYERPVRCP